MIDIDHSGSIDRAELAKICSDSAALGSLLDDTSDGALLSSLLDSDGDGRVSAAEFEGLFSKMKASSRQQLLQTMRTNLVICRLFTLSAYRLTPCC